MIACIPFKDTKRMVEISPCCYLYPGVRDKIFGLQNAGTVSSAGNLSSSMEAIFISVTNSRTISRYRRNPIGNLRYKMDAQNEVVHHLLQLDLGPIEPKVP
ncbi:13839_t:CDS:2 [Entrophospora sp. SA101]|nr:9128_t:CDS:2 [Entrophospora sp. SA101]CAJ0884923.1 13839_t:CDS:2 [Entrophospora sp. SA101]